MANKWTKSQQNAIDARNRNILVSAAAGSGKTAVLVERVIKLITDEENPVDIDKLLVVTFTNAAAAEMKARISKSLLKIIKEKENNQNALRQMALLPSAKICTIDSFCINLVRENFYKMNVSQDFSIVDNAEENIITDSVINEVLNDSYDEKDPAFISLVELLSSPKDDSGLISIIKKLHSYIYAEAFPFKWLDDIVEFYNPSIPFKDTYWKQIIKNSITDELNFGISLIDGLKEYTSPDDDASANYFVMLEEDKKIFEFLQEKLNDNWNDAKEAFENVSFSAKPRVNKKNPFYYEEELKAKRGTYKDIISSCLGLFSSTEEEYTEDMKLLYPSVKKLADIVKIVDEKILLEKGERNAYSFSDIEHFAIDILCKEEDGKIIKSDLANDLEDSFYEIFVDEYQDTNEAQDMLFKMLSNGKNRFMVGDVKQSIYRFRLAMPQIFTRKKNVYPLYDENKDDISSKIILDKNFRSKKGICDYVNYIFSMFMTEKIGEIDYTSEEYLNYGASYKDTATVSAQVNILDGKCENKDEREAEYIASVINKKVNDKELVQDGDDVRPIKYSDFAILLRSTSKHIGTYADVFEKRKIPVIRDQKANLLNNNEIMILVSLLKVIDNPMQDIPLLAIMMSPLYSFTADEMAEIKLENNFGSLYASVSNSNSQKANDFLKEISLFGKLSVTMSVSSFIRFLCEEKNIYAFVSAFGNSELRCRNIDRFIEFAAGFDEKDTIGLTAFMRYLEKVEKSDNGLESANLNPTSENAVSIMSVHHSKGLEFPVIILAGASRQYNMRDLSDKLLLNSTYGMGLKVHNDEGFYQYSSIPYTAIGVLNANAIISENLRVLYVAITRAKEQFISFISVDNLEKRINTLASFVVDGKVSPEAVKKFRQDSDMILLSALLHQNGSELQKLSSFDIKTVAADFKLDVEIKDTIETDEEIEETEKASPNEDIINSIKEKLSFSYSRKELSEISAKRTASSLDESIKNIDFFAKSKPAFMNDDKMTPSEKGTAMHTFMQFCSYENSKKDLELEITRLKNSGFITEKQAESLNRDALLDLFNSDFANRMFKSNKIYRELKISSFLKASEIAETNFDDKVLVQGIADCVFEENGELVLVDYKTDRVNDESSLLEMYKNQIAFYKSAVAKTLKKPVKEALLYSFSLGKVCKY